MDNTQYFNLKKPAPGDFYNVADFNDNADKIDAALNEKSNKGHKHTTADINAGVLSTAFGGTGMDNNGYTGVNAVQYFAFSQKIQNKTVINFGSGIIEPNGTLTVQLNVPVVSLNSAVLVFPKYSFTIDGEGVASEPVYRNPNQMNIGYNGDTKSANYANITHVKFKNYSAYAVAFDFQVIGVIGT